MTTYSKFTCGYKSEQRSYLHQRPYKNIALSHTKGHTVVPLVLTLFIDMKGE